MSVSRPYYDAPDPPDPMLDALYDSVALMMGPSGELTGGLVEVAGLVTRSLHGADGAGVALMRDGAVELRVASSKLIDDADTVQYGLGEGPCLSAVAEGRAIRTGSMEEQQTRWPRFAHLVTELGIGSMLSLPLRVRSEIIGSINVYALRGDGFSEQDAANGQRFAMPVAAAIRSAQTIRKVDQLADQMHETLQAKATVSTAVAMLGKRDHLPPEVAIQSLSHLAAEHEQSLVEAAAALIAHPETEAEAEPEGTSDPS